MRRKLPKGLLVSMQILFLLLTLIPCQMTTKGAEPQLIIQAPSQVTEGQQFDVTISYDDNKQSIPVEGAKVTFGDTPSITNSEGVVRFIAPPVLVDQSEKIYAEATGYLSASAVIIVKKIRPVQDLILAIIAPVQVNEGQQFDMSVSDNNGTLVSAVIISFDGNFYTTNVTGYLTLTAPLVTGTTTRWINASKTGYQSDSNTISIIDLTAPPLTPLGVVAPSQVYETNTFTVTVSAGNNFPIADASVVFAGTTMTTNTTGKTTFTAPSVSQNTTYTITATKTGYRMGETTILVKKQGPFTVATLVVTAPSQIYETNTFTVIITIDSNLPIAGASVVFAGTTMTTNTTGKTTFTAPSVSQNTTYTITATKTGYQMGETTILVKNQDQLQPTVNTLVINAQSAVDEDTTFQVTITANSTPINAVHIVFDGQNYTTDTLGTASLTAPSVSTDTLYLISAAKEGYNGSQITIIIRNVEQQTTPPVQYSKIQGTVTDEEGNFLQNAQVCIVLSNQNQQSVSRCVFTTSAGTYSLEVILGTYTMTAEKETYNPQTKENIMVGSTQTTEVNFVLQKQTPVSTGTEITNQLVDYAIQSAIDQRIIGAKITLSGEQKDTIVIYGEDINISLDPTNDTTNMTFTVVGPDGHKGTVIAVRINDIEALGLTQLSDLQKIQIIYDGVVIPMADDLSVIFQTQSEDTDPVWVGVLTTETLYALIVVPHFSEHIISIQLSPGQLLHSSDVLFTVFFYCAVAVVVGLIFIGTGEISKRR